jgi:hypothetical protein
VADGIGGIQDERFLLPGVFDLGILLHESACSPLETATRIEESALL